ncbi:MAG: SUMF1/EgtB/PvdO family nonheme iron enzyme [Planctomycetes bacterium]|nr:SUMF1/EgtB/PvdO family nonheme iron enzyme [Planctomycetota bacterium]
MIDPDQRQRVLDLFVRGSEIPEEDRAAFIEESCGQDHAVRSELESLFRSMSDGPSAFLVDVVEMTPEELFGETDAGPASLPEEGRSGRIGAPDIAGYTVLEKIAEGGMGAVYLADQAEPFRRRVVLKVIRPGLDSEGVLARFQAERQALALMSHRHIATVLGAGCDRQGRPYVAMEYVDGPAITTYCDEHQRTTRERLQLFSEVCHAIQHAHQKGVLHRDIKPSNVLVTTEGETPVPKVIDFGIAKALERPLGEDSLHTEIGTFLGTPEYMSPEQADTQTLDVDTRSDVYSLGVLLYELLVGELPFEPERLRRSSLLELHRILHEELPPRPSTRLTRLPNSSEVAHRRQSDVQGLARCLRGDLDWIVLKALEKEPDRRYASPLDLAADVERYLRHEPVEASPPSRIYRWKKFARRNLVAVSGVALFLCTLIAGLISTIHFMFEAQESERRWRVEAAAERTARAAEHEARQQARQALERFTGLRHVTALRRARDEERALAKHPAWPQQLPALERWLAEYASLPIQVASLAESVETLRAARIPDPAGMSWRFASGEDEFLHDALSSALEELEGFETLALVNVRRRVRWVEAVQGSLRQHAEAWDVACRAIARADGRTASTLYRSEPPLQLAPQVGLVPIGMNPKTRLWEFYHLRSAWDGISDPDSLVVPEHDPQTGQVHVHDGMGIVFVLLPGGTYWMGAQKTDPDGRNHDPNAWSIESPVHPVTLAPFFLARHELTKGQWIRLVGGAPPSEFKAGHNERGNPERISMAHPVEHVDWAASDRAMALHGLELPTEAQWEYGCRAGTDGPWWFAGRSETSERFANLGENAGHQDGRWIYGPVGACEDNPFGLHDTHGNVWEWCRDEFGSYAEPANPGDGARRRGDGSGKRVNRGGGYMGDVINARAARRGPSEPGWRSSNLGLRAARTVHQ